MAWLNRVSLNEPMAPSPRLVSSSTLQSPVSLSSFKLILCLSSKQEHIFTIYRDKYLRNHITNRHWDVWLIFTLRSNKIYATEVASYVSVEYEFADSSVCCTNDVHTIVPYLWFLQKQLSLKLVNYIYLKRIIPVTI